MTVKEEWIQFLKDTVKRLKLVKLMEIKGREN